MWTSENPKMNVLRKRDSIRSERKFKIHCLCISNAEVT